MHTIFFRAFGPQVAVVWTIVSTDSQEQEANHRGEPCGHEAGSRCGSFLPRRGISECGGKGKQGCATAALVQPFFSFRSLSAADSLKMWPCQITLECVLWFLVQQIVLVRSFGRKNAEGGPLEAPFIRFSQKLPRNEQQTALFLPQPFRARRASFFIFRSRQLGAPKAPNMFTRQE